MIWFLDISDFETEFPLLLLANAGFAMMVDDTIIPTAAIASIANVVVFCCAHVALFLHIVTLEIINPLLNLVK
jgi:hypothetical protein